MSFWLGEVITDDDAEQNVYFTGLDSTGHVDRSGGRAQFKAPVFSLLQWEPMTWEPANCPMCKQGSKAVHPGS